MADNKTYYLSGKESGRISRFNRKITRHLERGHRAKNVDPAVYTTKMRDENNVVEIDNLSTYFFTSVGIVKAVDGASFDIPKKTVVGVVGESGCGKSVMSLSMMQLLQRPQGQIVGGEIRMNMHTAADPDTNNEAKAFNIVKTPNDEMMRIRGNKVSMIFQEPMTSLNPVFRCGMQLDEVLELHSDLKTKEERMQRSIEMLNLVGIANSEGVYSMYPHELSGGMRQRVMIAMALACNPSLIIADEPTTALDVTIQAQILDLLLELKDKIDSSIMIITHDLGVIANMADLVVVMYAGRVIEKGTVHDVFHSQAHPYTLGLMKSKPRPGHKDEALYNIPGNVPNPVDMPDYCYFRDRCEMRCDKCAGQYPPEIKISDTHSVSCWRFFDQGKVLDYPKTVNVEELLRK